jgi:16S rRNA (uracil1498-N3)-methyltransferase
MPRYDFTTHRLFVRASLSEGATVALDRAQANYLLNVLRMKTGDAVLLFNGTDGEWRAVIDDASRRSPTLRVETEARPQTPVPDLHYLFAPLKQARLDYMVEKAVEMGVGRLRPVLTRHGQVTRLNRDRAEANAIEAA